MAHPARRVVNSDVESESATALQTKEDDYLKNLPENACGFFGMCSKIANTERPSACCGFHALCVVCRKARTWGGPEVGYHLGCCKAHTEQILQSLLQNSINERCLMCQIPCVSLQRDLKDGIHDLCYVCRHHDLPDDIMTALKNFPSRPNIELLTDYFENLVANTRCGYAGCDEYVEGAGGCCNHHRLCPICGGKRRHEGVFTYLGCCIEHSKMVKSMITNASEGDRCFSCGAVLTMERKLFDDVRKQGECLACLHMRPDFDKSKCNGCKTMIGNGNLVETSKKTQAVYIG